MNMTITSEESKIDSILQNFFHLNQLFSKNHKRIINSLQNSDFSMIPVIFIQGTKGKVMIDLQSINMIVESSNELLETDLQFTKILKNFELVVECISKTQRIAQFIKGQNEQLKTIVEKYNHLVKNSMQQLSYYFKQISSNPTATVSNLILQNNEKIKECVSKFIPLSIIEQGKTSTLGMNFLEKFRFDHFDDLNPILKVKKFRSCCENFKELLTFIGKTLISLYNSNCSQKFHPGPEVTSFNCREFHAKTEESKEKTSESRKNIVGKVRKLLNRGSLSKAEAKRVILNMNKPDFSMQNFEYLQTNEDHFNSSDDPLTETRVNPGDNASHFNEEMKKVAPFPKKTNSSCSALKRRVSSNSFSRNLSSSLIRNGSNSSKSKSRHRVNF